MKLKIAVFMFIACSMFIGATACNPSPSLSPESQSATDPPITVNESIDDQTMIPESNTGNTPDVDSIPLIFTDYSDFVLFGSKGELDASKYPNADILLHAYELDRAAFVNIKELFRLPNETSQVWSDEIVIENKNEYTYYVYSKDESNHLKLEYRITVAYDKDASDNETYHESIVDIHQISDMFERSGSFVFKTNHFDALYYKTESGYKSCTLIDGGLSIGVFFEGDGLTKAQIAEIAGSSISELFADDTGTVGQALTRMSDLLHESQSTPKN